ncbi:DinB family protein [Flavobacterium sp. HSC-61S13]|uniref:DinB family protein n=1 Tax=Flavobacterium sp. HSC-61S13 TaxID=2910963 RepID=UPI00209EA13C|nr:DinB family protein [Flavobacterium sp. HSC-61S13]MCP1995453.1 putative damage-inducible protein DinB [Flavobacterium sp. HSC-61S13]
MKLSHALLAEYTQEAATTRSLLAVIPFEQNDFKPHEKSMTLKQLYSHVADISGWWDQCLIQDELDFSKSDFTPKDFKDNAALLAYFDQNVMDTTKILNEVDEAEFGKDWTMRSGEQIFGVMPKSVVARSWCLNHWYHHRGQLSVYLRMLNVPLPSIYGPTADTEGK